MRPCLWRRRPTPRALSASGVLATRGSCCATPACAAPRGWAVFVSPGFQAQVWSARERKPIRKTFRELAEAKAWRQESQVALRKGTLRAPSHDHAERGRRASGSPRRQRASSAPAPATPTSPPPLRAYRQALNHRVLPTLGSKRLTAISHTMLQDLADQLAAAGLSPSSVRNTILPLRAIYRRALNRGEVAINPTLKLALPAVRGRRDRIAAPDEVAPSSTRSTQRPRDLGDRPLRRSPPRRTPSTRLDTTSTSTANLIHVERSWDRTAGFIDPKSRSGNRRVPITTTLRRDLLTPPPPPRQPAAKASSSPTAHGHQPFNPSTLAPHANTAWARRRPHPDRPARMPPHATPPT